MAVKCALKKKPACFCDDSTDTPLAADCFAYWKAMTDKKEKPDASS